MVIQSFILSLLAITPSIINGQEFRGGLIDWRPQNRSATSFTVEILVHQKYAWKRSTFSPVCSNLMISSQGSISNGIGFLQCFTGGSCSLFANISADVFCTDFNITSDYSIGERYDIVTVPLNTMYVIGFTSSIWLSSAINGNGNFQLTSKINLALRPDGFINASPVALTIPIVYGIVNVQQVHVVEMIDADTTDILRCRWATNYSIINANNFDECGSICSPTMPSFTLYQNNCTLVFNLTNTSYYAVALQIEDYYDSTITTPMSSVPVQFLFYGINAPTSCSIPPQIIGNRPNSACIGIPIGILTNETVIGQVGCVGKTIVDFITTSPIGLVKSAIINPSPGIYTISLLFTPNRNQTGPQIFCAAAIDNTNVQSQSWCVTFLVDFTAPSLLSPLNIQGLVSPRGTLTPGPIQFQIQSVNGVPINRPVRSGTYISFHDLTLNGTVVLRYDCASSSNVAYVNNIIFIATSFNWTINHHYYITLDSGVATSNDFCHAESAPITDPAFWQFNFINTNLPNINITTTTVSTTSLGTTTSTTVTTTSVTSTTTTSTTVTTTSVTSTTTSRNTTTVSTTMAVSCAIHIKMSLFQFFSISSSLCYFYV